MRGVQGIVAVIVLVGAAAVSAYLVSDRIGPTVARHGERLDALASKAGEQDQAIGRHEHKLDQQGDAITVLQREVDAAKVRLAAGEERLLASEGRLESAEKRLRDGAARTDRQDESIAALREEATKLAASVALSRQEADLLRQDYQQRIQELDELQSRMAGQGVLNRDVIRRLEQLEKQAGIKQPAP